MFGESFHISSYELDTSLILRPVKYSIGWIYHHLYDQDPTGEHQLFLCFPLLPTVLQLTALHVYICILAQVDL